MCVFKFVYIFLNQLGFAHRYENGCISVHLVTLCRLTLPILSNLKGRLFFKIFENNGKSSIRDGLSAELFEVKEMNKVITQELIHF